MGVECTNLRDIWKESVKFSSSFHSDLTGLVYQMLLAMNLIRNQLVVSLKFERRLRKNNNQTGELCGRKDD